MSWRFVTRHPTVRPAKQTEIPGRSHTYFEMTAFVQFSAWSHYDSITHRLIVLLSEPELGLGRSSGPLEAVPSYGSNWTGIAVRRSYTLAMISPWGTRNHPSGCAAHRRHAFAIERSSSTELAPDATSCVPIADVVMRSAHRPAHHARSSAVA